MPNNALNYPQSGDVEQTSGNNPNPYQQPGNTGGTFNPNDSYDTRVGNGALPGGIYGSQNRAYVRDVNGNELVQNQMGSVLNSDSPYIQNARLNGTEMANSRGLLNSSIAAGAAQREAIQAALPIAASDAQAYRDAQGQNLQYLNERALADLASGTQITTTNLNNSAALQRQRENLAYSGEQAGLDRAFTQMRDYLQSRYTMERDNNNSRNNIQEYAAQTGINLHTQQIQFWNALQQAAINDPETWSPENVAGMFATYQPVYQQFQDNFDQWLQQLFGGSNQGPGG